MDGGVFDHVDSNGLICVSHMLTKLIIQFDFCFQNYVRACLLPAFFFLTLITSKVH